MLLIRLIFEIMCENGGGHWIQGPDCTLPVMTYVDINHFSVPTNRGRTVWILYTLSSANVNRGFAGIGRIGQDRCFFILSVSCVSC